MIATNTTRRGEHGPLVSWCLGGLLLLTAIVYSRSLGSEFILDHRASIVGNPYLKDWSFLWRSLVNDEWWFIDPSRAPISSYYRPIPNLWLWLNFQLFGASPPGWRAAMIALHLLNVWLVFRVAAILTASRWAGLFAAALFALSPLNAEAVVASFSTPICTAFELGALECYLRNTESAPADRQRLRRGLLSIGLFGGALLSYEGAVTFPFLVAAHAFLLEPNRSYGTDDWLAARARNAIAAAWPYALAVLAYLALRIRVLGFIGRPSLLAHHLTGRQAILTIPGAVWTYAMLLAAPWRAGPAHWLEFAGSIAAPEFYLPAIALTAASAAALLILRNRPHRALYLYCAAWFPIALAPMLNLNGVSTTDPIHDRYLYFSSIGFYIMAAGLAAGLAQKGAAWQEAVLAIAAGGSIAYGAMLYQVQRFWHDDVAIYSHLVSVFPRAPGWHRRLAAAFKERGNLTKARKEIEAAIRLAPDAANPLSELAIVDEEMGDRRGAERAIAERIRRIDRPSPADYSALAFAADAAGDSAGAEAALKQAEALPGGAGTAAIARAQIRFLHGDRKGSESALRAILDHDPANAQALSVLGSILLDQRRYGDALKILRGAVALDPRNLSLHYKIAIALHGLGREREAREECAAVLAGAPADRKALALMDAIEQGGAAN